MNSLGVNEDSVFDQTPLAVFISALANTTDPSIVGTAICRGLLARWSPIQTVIRVHRPEINCLEMVAHYGLSDAWAKRFSVIPLTSNLPACASFRRGVEIHLPVQDARERFPLASMAGGTRFEGDDGLLSVVPLRSGGMPIGTLVVMFDQPVALNWQLRSALDDLIAAITLWARAAWIAVDPKQPPPVPQPLVSKRQVEILTLAADGRTNANIATELGYSTGTVKAEIAALLRLFGASDRNDLITKATQSWM
jgi:DNA-binding CsgD family transcriptional regulator